MNRTMNKITRFLIASFLFLSSCKKQEFDIVNLNDNKITALGHAGMGIASTYPMDSYESILSCLNLHMDGSEFDVQMTKDSVLVAFHDLELSDKTNLKGTINSMNWSDVKNGHYNITPYLTNYSIISLEQLFSNIDNIKKYKFTFDCKLYTNDNDINRFYERYMNEVIKIIQKHDIEDNVYIESQSREFLSLFKSKKPAYRLFIYPSSFEEGLEIASSLHLYGITISTRNITKEQIKTAHDNGLLVAVWNTHTENDNIEAINKNPDFIQTDKVKGLLKLLK